MGTPLEMLYLMAELTLRSKGVERETKQPAPFLPSFPPERRPRRPDGASKRDAVTAAARGPVRCRRKWKDMPVPFFFNEEAAEAFQALET